MENQLVCAAAKGDSDAFEQLIKPYEKMMYAIALRMCKNSEEAKDCMQDAMIRIYRSLSAFRGDSSFSTWIYRIVTNTCLDNHRRKKVRAAESLDALSECGWNMPDTNPGPEKAVENSSLKALLSRALGTLPDEIKAAVVLRDVHGMSYEEVASILDINIGTVKSRISRGREKLRAFLLSSGEL